jgi:hypothetical protein
MAGVSASDRRHAFDLHVRGEIPPGLGGYLVVPTSRRAKDRGKFSRWHDAQTDLIRLDLYPGRPGRVRANVLEIDPTGADVGMRAPEGAMSRWYVTQPNHGVNFARPRLRPPADGLNIADRTLWATNLLFGAPLEVELTTLTPRRVLRFVEPNESAPQVSGTAHFAWSADRRYAYFHQSLFCDGIDGLVRADDLRLVELEVSTGSERTWRIKPPAADAALETANFHSAFGFVESGIQYVGLLRTGALLETLAPHDQPVDHAVAPASASTIWIVRIDHQEPVLQAELLPGIGELDGLALSHLDVDTSGGDGFVLYANFKEADVGEETHGPNIYGETPATVTEHYSGMVVEALNFGLVIRYERRASGCSLKTFRRGYDPGRASLGHSWLPINIELDTSRRRLFCTFSGFRPRLLSRHVAERYGARAVDPSRIRYVPPLLMRFNAETLEPDLDADGGYFSYAEPIALAIATDGQRDYVCTFSPEVGLRIYLADDLNHMICHAESPSLMHWRDSHFRPEPAHMQFAPR